MRGGVRGFGVALRNLSGLDLLCQLLGSGEQPWPLVGRGFADQLARRLLLGAQVVGCLLYTSDAADDTASV